MNVLYTVKSSNSVAFSRKIKFSFKNIQMWTFFLFCRKVALCRGLDVDRAFKASASF